MADQNSTTVCHSAQQLEKLMEYGADVCLEFDDGFLPASSIVLGLHSSVLKGAVEAAAQVSRDVNSSNSSSSSKKRKADNIIPMPGTKMTQWLELAPFLYPVSPPPDISSIEQLEVLLEMASKYDIVVVLNRVDRYLLENSWQLVAHPESQTNVWKWLRLADKAGLQQCLPLLAERAAEVDKLGLAKGDNLQGLTPHVLQQLLRACSGMLVTGRVGDDSMQCCRNCISYTAHKAAWVCQTCRRAQL